MKCARLWVINETGVFVARDHLGCGGQCDSSSRVNYRWLMSNIERSRGRNSSRCVIRIYEYTMIQQVSVHTHPGRCWTPDLGLTKHFCLPYYPPKASGRLSANICENRARGHGRSLALADITRCWKLSAVLLEVIITTLLGAISWNRSATASKKAPVALLTRDSVSHRDT